MTTPRMLIVLVLMSTFSLTRADYNCLCNYNVETPVLDKTGSSDSSNNIGTLYEFDCKPVVHAAEVDRKQWATIAYEHQEGYVKLNSGLKIQTCPGNPDKNDLVTTKFPPTTTTTLATSTKITTKMTETSRRSTKPTTVITEASSSSSTPTTSTTASSTTEQQTTPSPTSTHRPTTISTTEPSTTSTTSTSSTTHGLTTTTSPTSSSVSTTASTTQSTTWTSTQQQTTPSTLPSSTYKPTTGTTQTTTSTSPVTLTSATQSSTTTARSTTSRPGPFSLGNTMLCPASVRYHASRNYGIVAQYGGSCYSIERHSVSWVHAESTCKQYGGHLLHISSAAENYFIYRLLDTKYNHTVWTGLHDRGHEEQFTWASGSPVIYTNWYPNRKSNFMNHNDEDCVVFVPYLHHGQWDDVDCGFNDMLLESFYEAHPFICQYAVTTIQPSVTASTIGPLQHSSGNINLCPTNRRILGTASHLAQNGNSCYEWFTGRSSWQHAETNCVSHGGHLVQIKDANEESFIQWFLNTHDPRHAIWIGLYDLGHEETFKWTSGDPVSYTNWIPGRKSNFVSHTVEDCVAYIPYKQGQWDDIPCGSSGGLFGDSGETHPYMCEYKIQSGTSSILGGLIG